MSVCWRRNLLSVSFLIIFLLWLATFVVYCLDRVILERFYISRDDSSEEEEVVCDGSSISTSNLDDIVIKGTSSVKDAEKLVQDHGALVIPEVLSRETARLLREEIQKGNKNRNDDFFTPSRRNRSRQVLSVFDNDIYYKSLQEISEHPLLKPLLNSVVGPDPALLGMFTVTNLPGSRKQNWHQDTIYEYSYRCYPDIFFRDYFLVIALQDTTEKMGATSICPGTQQCRKMNWNTTKEDSCFQAPLNAGGGMFFNNEIVHRGGGHDDEDAPDRVYMFLNFLPRTTASDDRTIPVHLYHLRWHMFGFTLNDFASSTFISKPLAMWNALGLPTFPPSKVRGYSFPFYLLHIIANGRSHEWRSPDGKGVKIRWIDVEDFWLALFRISCIVTSAWIACFVALKAFVAIEMLKKQKGGKKHPKID